MREFKAKVAVVTGAASGIGQALANQCGGEGMHRRPNWEVIFSRALSSEKSKLRAERFWILPHPEFKPAYQRRVESMMQETNPDFQAYEV